MKVEWAKAVRAFSMGGTLASHPVLQRWAPGVALLSGMAMGLAPDPVNAWPLAWIMLGPLWILAIAPMTLPASTWGDRQRRALYGFFWGLGYYGVTLFWIWGLHPLTWMGVPWLASVAIALFCWLFVMGLGAVSTALWALLLNSLSTHVTRSRLALRLILFLRRQSQRHTQTLIPLAHLLESIVRVWVGVTLWCLIDLALSRGILYWPALSLTQSPHNLFILHLGQWTGPLGIAAVIIAVNGLLAEAVVWSWMPHRSPQPPASGANSRPDPTTARRCGAIALALLLTSHGLGLALYSRPLAPHNQTSLTVGIIQGNIPTRIKLYENGLRLAFQRYTEGYDRLADAGVDAVLTPEGAMPIVWANPVKSRTPLYQAVIDRQVPLWLGTFVPKGRDITQSLIALNDQGDTVSQYNKVMLVPLGEYIPLNEWLGSFISRLSPLESYMVPGDRHQQFETPWGQAIVGICYESAFSHLFRRQAADGGQFILTASNNDPYSTVMMAQHHAQDVIRAIETDRWAVRATNTGYSGLVDPHGRTVWRSPAHAYVTHIAQLYSRQTRTLYVRAGDWIIVVLVLGAIAIILGCVWPGRYRTG